MSCNRLLIFLPERNCSILARMFHKECSNMCFFVNSGPSDAPLASNNFESFLKVPEFLRPHNQIYCTRY